MISIQQQQPAMTGQIIGLMVCAEFRWMADRLGVGRDGRLYWDGKQIEMRQRLLLSRPQALMAFLAATAAISVAVLDALRYFGF